MEYRHDINGCVEAASISYEDSSNPTGDVEIPYREVFCRNTSGDGIKRQLVLPVKRYVGLETALGHVEAGPPVLKTLEDKLSQTVEALSESSRGQLLFWGDMKQSFLEKVQKKFKISWLRNDQREKMKTSFLKA